MEKYPSGRRGSPAKGVVRVTAARVQIPASPLINPRNFNVPRVLICLYCPTAAQRVQKACLKTIEKQGRQKIDSDDFFSLILKKRGFTLCRMKPLCAFYRLSMNACIRSAESFFIFSVTCPYTNFRYSLPTGIPINWDLYVCFLVLWMQKTFHCLAEFFRQLALRRMTAPLNQMQFFSRSRDNIHVILYQPDRTDPVA